MHEAFRQQGAAPQGPAPQAHEAVFQAAPADERLYSLEADGRRRFIRPIQRRGGFWRKRRVLAYALVALFFATPHVWVGAYPAVLLDLTARRFHVLGNTFYPTDNLLLLAVGFGVIVTVFFVASVFGRMWCGYACPQTVYLEFLFRPIEVWLEGNPVRQRKLNAAPWGARKLGVKAAKWGLWALLAFAMAFTFVSYFVGFGALARGLVQEPLAFKGALGSVAFLTVLITFDFGWFRDQMCTVACPYGRLQSVLADPDTVFVAYDARRGEPRARAMDRQPALAYGDCIDCRSCVSSCPTGTDIRRGLQLECVGVAQCVDACNAVMAGLGKPLGLIGYSSQRQQQTGERRFWRPRVFVYVALMALAWGALLTMVLTRADAQVEFVRGGQEAFRALPTGEIANQQRLRVTNQIDRTQAFTLEVLEPAGASLIVSEVPLVVEPEELKTINVVTKAPRAAFERGRAQARYRIRSDQGFSQELEFLLLGPYR